MTNKQNETNHTEEEEELTEPQNNTIVPVEPKLINNKTQTQNQTFIKENDEGCCIVCFADD